MYTPHDSYSMGASAYARIGAESSAMSATPHQLITMLFDGAETAITMARHHMSTGEISAKGLAISKAINIVDNGLKASLDPESGGAEGAKLAANLSAFYDYITQRLLQANLRNETALLDEALRLLGNISSAWREIDPHQPGRVAEMPSIATSKRFSAGA